MKVTTWVTYYPTPVAFGELERIPVLDKELAEIAKQYNGRLTGETHFHMEAGSRDIQFEFHNEESAKEFVNATKKKVQVWLAEGWVRELQPV